ncbi:MAG TPA: TetR family transcriptional regulator [Candidatus Corynebacterium avicola]|uniref:TetR family transcriptional regulator n=1 Tax=Candidatus Corynebacterium avicola TaxID=2838527 RepID=A0A9D1RPI4_9CORY|nr:TetR family transcriptional regulator [Candidatus Corynebacterium avicola]
MPPTVDHDARRREIISSVWRLIADEGLDAVTTRRIAEATGYSNGLLRYYFPGKDAVVTAAFEFIYAATNDRALLGDKEDEDGRRGLAGLERLALEILPLDDTRRAEARVVTAFWQRAITHEDEAAIHADRMAGWRGHFLDRLAEAEADGELGGQARATAPEDIIDELMTLLMGAQVWAALHQEESSPERLTGQLDRLIRRLRTA